MQQNHIASVHKSVFMHGQIHFMHTCKVGSSLTAQLPFRSTTGAFYISCVSRTHMRKQDWMRLSSRMIRERSSDWIGSIWRQCNFRIKLLYQLHAQVKNCQGMPSSIYMTRCQQKLLTLPGKSPKLTRTWRGRASTWAPTRQHQGGVRLQAMALGLNNQLAPGNTMRQHLIITWTNFNLCTQVARQAPFVLPYNCNTSNYRAQMMG